MNIRSHILPAVISLVLWAAATWAQDNGSQSESAKPWSTATQDRDHSSQIESAKPVSSRAPDAKSDNLQDADFLAASEEGMKLPSVADTMAGKASDSEIRHRPLLYFRLWANKPLHIVPMSLFVFLTTLVLGEIFKSNLEATRDCARRQFWRSFGRGAWSVLLTLAFVRPLFVSGIGSPLAVLLIALVELVLLAGLAVSVTLLGEVLLKRLAIADKLSVRPFVFRLTTAVLGTIVIGLIMSIPGIGCLPPVGIRLILLFCILGAGSLLKTQFGTKPVEGK